MGQSATLTWSSQNADSCVASGAWSGAQALSGSLSVAPTNAGSSAYTLSCTGPGGTVEQSATLTLNPGFVFSASSSTLVDGQSATLTWTGVGLSSCTASGAWSGSQPTSGSVSVSPAPPGSFSYTLTCAAPAGNISQSAMLTVIPAVSLSASTTTVTLGQNFTLTWSTLGATACTAGGTWSGSQSLAGTVTVTPASTGVYRYTLNCTGNGEAASQSLSVQVSPAVSLTLSPASVPAGQSAAVAWSSQGATACTAGDAWAGAQSTSGVAMTAPTTPGAYVYALSCTDGRNDTTQVTADLSVTPNGYALTSLVADSSTTSARTIDPDLLDSWGIAFAAGPVVVVNRLSNTSSSYDGGGAPSASAPLIVKLPAGSGGEPFGPTGVVVNSAAADFTVTAAAKSGAAAVIYAGESGMIAGWSSQVDPANAITAYADAGGAVYKGLALASNGSANFLYATDFHNNKIDVFDRTFKKQATSATSFPFADPTVPAGFAPFGIQALSVSGLTRIYVTYAKQLAPDNRVNVSGAGLGLVNVFDPNGKLLSATHLIAPGGALNAPWGLALAPARDFGTLAGALLVSNSGDGTVQAFDPMAGTSLGTLEDSTGTPLALPGMRGIVFGNRHANQPQATLFFAAGTNSGTGGEYGRIDFGAAPRLHAPPSLSLRVIRCGPLPFELCYSRFPGYEAIANVADTSGIGKVDFFRAGTYTRTIVVAPYRLFGNGTPPPISVTVTDVDGNIATAP